MYDLLGAGLWAVMVHRVTALWAEKAKKFEVCFLRSRDRPFCCFFSYLKILVFTFMC